MPMNPGFRLPARGTAEVPQPLGRRAVIAAAVALGLIASSAAVAGAATPDPGSTSGKQARMRQMAAQVSKRPNPNRARLASGGPVGRLALDLDAGKVVLSVKVRAGASAPTSLSSVARAAKAQGAEQRRVLRQLSTVSVEVSERAAASLKAQLQARPDVVRVDTVARRHLTFVPNDDRYAATAPYLDAIAAPSAWEVHRGDAAVKIAVVDSGVDIHHPDLEGRISDTYNAVPGTPDVTDVTDDIGHGTFVAGVAAATADNGVGIAGASMGASVMAVKVADDQGEIYTDAEAAGITWAADHGAKVINLSLGSTVADPTERDAIAYAVGKGSLVVASAGNDAASTPSYPAAYPNVVAVGATDAAGHRASFSQYGPWVTVAAPGTGITGTAPTAGSAYFQPNYDVGAGTSFSAPLVSAEAALLWSLRPGASATEVRAAIIASAHGYAGLGLGAGQVDFRAADDALRPDTVPVLGTPADGASIAGQVTLTATSTAPKVRFLLDGTPLGTPVPVNAGTASIAWPTWGLTNGSHTLAAVDCSISDLCNTQTSQASVTLTNDAPAMTSPKTAQTLTGSATFTATAPGGAVAFLIDGTRRGLDTTAPYALTYPVSSLHDGPHTVTAVSCSPVGVCNGPSSAPISFTALSLHPRFSSVSPGQFSPNGDGRYDTTKITWSLPDSEAVSLVVRNAAGTVVRGPLNFGTQAAGAHSYLWNGVINSGAHASSGTYGLELTTNRPIPGGRLYGSAVGSIRVDTVAPTLASITGSGTTFYPYPDGYRDTVSPAFTLNEPATVTLTVKNSAGSVVRTVLAYKAAGRSSLTWNGRNSSGALAAGGTYYWTLTAQDPAGNRRTSARYSVIVNAKRLITKTATLVENGNAFTSAGGSASCAEADTTMSDFAYGVWLTNYCDPYLDGTQIAAAIYRFTVPAAVSYTSLRVDALGFSLAPSSLTAGYTQWATGHTTFTPIITAGTASAWRTVGSVAAAGFVNSSRIVEASLVVPNVHYPDDYDIGQVRLAVTYKVLA